MKLFTRNGPEILLQPLLGFGNERVAFEDIAFADTEDKALTSG